MTEATLGNDFKRFATQPADVVEGALLVSRLIDRTTDVTWCRSELSRLAAKVGLPSSASAIIDMPQVEGFAGAKDYYEARNSSLQFVLHERRGIPISLYSNAILS